MAEVTTSRKPEDTPFKQQKLAAWQPILTPWKVIAIFLAIGVIFVPVGVKLLDESKNIYESTKIYDGKDVDVDNCELTDNNCMINFTMTQDVDGPIYVYYELKNFYQNHRRYVKSRSSYQLEGQDLSTSDVKTDCDPLYEDGDQLLNPCGLIANSLFNDVITLPSDSNDYSLDEQGISWLSDRKVKFKQVDGFKSAKNPTNESCKDILGKTDCKSYTDSNGELWAYYYPSDDTTTYLYELYPMVVTPLEGVENEHFIVWMRTAGLPTFRKLYGRIHSDLKKGDVLRFNVSLNFDVDSFDGSKGLVISNLGQFGGKNSFLGISYIVVGSISLMLGFLFGIKQLVSPRPLGDVRYLGWSS